MKESPDLTLYAAGIPCGVVIDTYLHVPSWRGPLHLCPSDADCYGYEETEYHLIDRKGYSAPWLERKLSAEDKEEIEQAISTHYTQLRNDAQEAFND